MLSEKRSVGLFNLIAPVYGLFFKFQKRHYQDIIKKHNQTLHLFDQKKVLDVGCGTGALCSALAFYGLHVTGVDPAKKMLDIAKRKTKSESIKYLQADVLNGLPFEDNSFDVVFSSYVVHGLNQNHRKKMYAEMSRIAGKYVVIHDYNKSRALLTTIIEWLERGDYFNFIKNQPQEMQDCVVNMRKCFSEVEVVQVSVRANWYVCKPFKQ